MPNGLNLAAVKKKEGILCFEKEFGAAGLSKKV